MQDDIRNEDRENNSGKRPGGGNTALRIVQILAIIVLALIAAMIVFFVIQNTRKSGGSSASSAPAASEAAAPEESADATSTSDAAGSKEESESSAESSEESPAESSEASSEEASAEESSESTPPPAEGTVYVTGSDVNIRAQATTESASLGKAQRGDAFQSSGNEGDWIKIDYNGQTGYIRSDFLAAELPQKQDWDLASLDNTSLNYGYSRTNRDESNIPADIGWYEANWGQFDVDWMGDWHHKTIYLTMDEGFTNEETTAILKILEEKGVPVTFFVTKYFVDEAPDLVQAILDGGHQLGNHSCTHRAMPSLTIEEQTAEITDLNNLVKDKFGYELKAFRYPEGVYSEQSLGLVNNLGMQVTFWSFAYKDYDKDDQMDPAEALKMTLDELHPGAIYLLHADSTTNVKILADFIDGARAAGYEFGTYPIHGSN